MKEAIKIGLFGFGCVGYGIYETLRKTTTINASIKTICVKDKDKPRQLAAGRFVYDKAKILADKEINVVIEVINDADAAFAIVSEALRSGKAVITANKQMVSEHFEELLELQTRYQVPLLYEAAVCASIPVIRNLEEYYDNDLLTEVQAIVNGSTNYILTQISAKGLSYPAALRQAQELGYAETDPVADTGGFDARHKLTIILAHAFGLVVSPTAIVNIGIDQLSQTELDYAAEKGWKIKLVAIARLGEQQKVTALVMPQFVKPDNLLYDVDDVYNGVKIWSGLAEMQFFYGKGAGAYPTASAILSDISALQYNYRYGYKKLGSPATIALPQDVLVKVMMRFTVPATQTYRSFFIEVTETYQNQQSGYVVGVLPLSAVQRLSIDEGASVSFVLFDVVFSDDASAELSELTATAVLELT